MYLIMLSAKKEGIKYHFLSFCYDLTWDRTSISQTISKHFTHKANEPVKQDNSFMLSILRGACM